MKKTLNNSEEYGTKWGVEDKKILRVVELKTNINIHREEGKRISQIH